MKSRIKEWIVRKDLSNEEVSRKLEVSRETVSKWANNKAYPSLKMAYKLADLLNVKVDDLYDRKKE
ncbi:helix-turn-helix domain-containing protein [Halobacillus seohaensis]|uniref:Helix-turn-helix transcriptional regulator n=1 Tax=Halobacillus seohaensis TaxID=447421 RepID=A0ABW2ESN8_9BACI